MKGFLAIKLSDHDYYPILELDDISVKKMVLGKVIDSVSINLDFYLSRSDNFSNSVLIGSFSLDNLKKENSNINIYFKVANEMLYVYGESAGIHNKSKFDLSLFNFNQKSETSGEENLKKNDLNNNVDQVTSIQSLEAPPFSNDNRLDSEFLLDFKDEDNNLEEVVENDFNLNTSILDPVGSYSAGDQNFKKKYLKSDSGNSNAINSTTSFDILSLSDDKFFDENMNFDAKLGLEIDKEVIENKKDVVDYNSLEPERSDRSDKTSLDSEIFNLEDPKNEYIDTNSFDFDNSESSRFEKSSSDEIHDLSVEDIISGIDKDLVDSEDEDIEFFFQEDKRVSSSKSSFQIDSDKGIVHSSMLYISFISLFLLIFFSLFLIFSKILKSRDFVSCHFDCWRGSIEKHEKSYNV